MRRQFYLLVMIPVVTLTLVVVGFLFYLNDRRGVVADRFDQQDKILCKVLVAQPGQKQTAAQKRVLAQIQDAFDCKKFSSLAPTPTVHA